MVDEADKAPTEVVCVLKALLADGETLLSHPCHTPVTPLSHPCHTPVTPRSHPGHTPVPPPSQVRSCCPTAGVS
jgi:hypothetical protein